MLKFKVILFFALLLLSACATTQGGVKPVANGSLAIDPQVRERAKGNGAITLLDHQLVPIDYLHKNPDQRGLLVNHYMGTGKTYLGIGFAESFPKHPVIILAPKFLESHWSNQIDEYGVKDKKRYTFISYDDAPAKLGKMDLSHHVVLADEVHNLIKHLRNIDQEVNEKYTEVYSNLRKAYKILGLTGTPIFGDESDLAFIVNLVSGENLMPFNQEAFRLEYTSILPTRQFFRGYVTESNMFLATLPMALGFFSIPILGPFGFLTGAVAGILGPVIVNQAVDLNTFKLRKLNVNKMQPMMHKYVSYFRFDESQFKEFPAQDFRVMEIPYSRQQYSFFLRLVEGDLPTEQLQRLLKNEAIQRDDNFVAINSTNIHEKIYSAVGAGRDIGNFEFKDKDGAIIEPPKFMRILDELKANNDQTVLYSNYYQTGILAFRDFLMRQGYTEKYAIIEPNLPMHEVNEIVSNYNKGKIKLLLLHPEVTEGISLRGTQYLHILEPMLNSTVLEQVIGRTRRFQSHTHLPLDKQKVHVRLWQSTSSTWNPNLGDINRANWYKRYRELSYMSRWGIGLSQVDKKMDRKALNPEELALLKQRTIEQNFKEMQEVLTVESIENKYEKMVR